MKKIKILAFIALVSLASCTKKRTIDYVNPFIGTGGHGHTYPGPSMPFGMVQLGPDTRLTGWDGCSGYHYFDSVVYGFSHTHLSGTGISDYGDILLMPTTGKIQLNKGSEENSSEGYCSGFNKKNETAYPGFYSVLLDDYEINVELTVTKRAGFHRYTFPESENAHILIDLEHRDPVIESGIRFTSDTEIEGYRRSKEWAKDQQLFFVAKFSKSFDSYGVAINDERKEDIPEAEGKNVKAWINYKTKQHESILVKVGISAVSIEGARKNLEAEIPEWDFNAIKTAAEQAWEDQLNKIQVTGGTKEQHIIFYTSLYHASLNPNLYMDVDRKYRGRDNKIHEAKDYDYYTLFSLWDTFRGEHPLFTVIEPEKTIDFIRTFIAQYEQGGALPVWELSANETGTMIGYHAIPVIVDAYKKGLSNFDIEKAYEAMKHSAEQEHEGLKFFRKLGFIPVSEESESVSKTLEYAYDDWCIAQVAMDLGKEDDYEYFIRRAQSYKNIFDPTTGFMRGRINGGWFTPFDPKEVNFNYTEANSWQYSFFVPQDIQGLIQLMGGREKFVEKLDLLFSESTETTGRQQSDITGLIGQYAHGNEPSHHMAYLYNYAGQPWKTQEMIKRIRDEMYTTYPDGLSGNEDAGQMSAWYVLSAMGFYSVTPGTDYYTIGTPLFNKVTINLPDGKKFRIKTENLSGTKFYIQSAKLNGKDYSLSYIRHSDILSGGELTFQMGSKPGMSWGVNKEDIPFSSIENYLIQPAPFVEKGDRTFTSSTEVVLGTTQGASIFYTLDGSEPTLQSAIYQNPIAITKSTKLDMFSRVGEEPKSVVVTAEFNRIPPGRTIRLLSEYAPQYSAGGDMALIDFIRGPKNFRTGSWQGYEGVDLEAVVDFGKKQPFQKISIGFLQDIGSWVFMPEQVEFYISNNGKSFILIGKAVNDIPLDELGVIIKDFGINVYPKNVRYFKIVAKSIKICPEWHKGAGGKAWVFADEIVVK